MDGHRSNGARSNIVVAVIIVALVAVMVLGIRHDYRAASRVTARKDKPDPGLLLRDSVRVAAAEIAQELESRPEVERRREPERRPEYVVKGPPDSTSERRQIIGYAVWGRPPYGFPGESRVPDYFLVGSDSASGIVELEHGQFPDGPRIRARFFGIGQDSGSAASEEPFAIKPARVSTLDSLRFGHSGVSRLALGVTAQGSDTDSTGHVSLFVIYRVLGEEHYDDSLYIALDIIGPANINPDTFQAMLRRGPEGDESGAP